MKTKFKIFTVLLLFFAVFSFAQKTNLKNEITKITDGKKATVAVSVLSLDDSSLNLNINGDMKLPMQSVFKFHIALAVLDQVDKGKHKLDSKIYLMKSQLIPNTWSPLREKYPDGNVHVPLSEIIELMVAQSDNNAADILIKLVGGTEAVQKFISSKGIKDFAIQFTEEKLSKVYDFQYHNYTATSSLNQLFKKFYAGKVVSKESTEFLMKTLQATTTGKNRLIAQLPANAVVAHKTGSSSTQDGLTAATNDAGIVTLPNGKHYAITVFVIDSKESEETNEKIISDISKKVWDYFR